MGQTTDSGVKRLFTAPRSKAYDSIAWAKRDSELKNPFTGEIVFAQKGVEIPESWSLNALNIVAQKYFTGTPGTKEREASLKQLIDRVVDTVVRQGQQEGYFDSSSEAETFREELKYVLATQRAAFNSPVWFNIGAPERAQQASACFILGVEDTMPSILQWYTDEGMIFKGGSGSGVNVSPIRSSVEPLGKSAGTASGPLSFMRGADASAGAIKSGGKTRRAAKMVILNVDHPDIEEFIWCKSIEEDKARALQAAGFDMSLDGKDIFSVQYQNANNSVRVTDEFMQAVVADTY
jgi:ribonucleoside-diphosphate reductase alpha chain